jgi:oxygen-independent coproporphyrinogen III oxidase
MKEIESLYIHFPFCQHLCNYCDFYKKVPSSIHSVENYQKYLLEGYDKHKSLLDSLGYGISDLKTLYIGGGTPSLWNAGGASFLKKFFTEKKIGLKADGEYTLEVNPGGWTRKGLSAWENFGINRYSLGVQSLNDNFLKILDRFHNVEQVHETLEYFSRAQKNFSVDLMLGLPRSFEEKRNVIAELEEILQYEPNHFSLYILTTKSNYQHRGNLPDEEYIANEYREVANFLKNKGYHHYEVSNFAKESKESLHNLMYWNSGSVAAFGPSATGFLAKDNIRYKWKPQSIDFERENLTISQAKLEKLYMGLRVSSGIHFYQFIDESEFKLWPAIREKWIEHQYIMTCREVDKISLTSQGFLLLDMLMDELFLHFRSL